MFKKEHDYLDYLRVGFDEPFEVGDDLAVLVRKGEWVGCKVLKDRGRDSDSDKPRYLIQVLGWEKARNVDAERLRYPAPRMSERWVGKFASAFGFPALGDGGSHYAPIVSQAGREEGYAAGHRLPACPPARLPARRRRAQPHAPPSLPCLDRSPACVSECTRTWPTR